MEKKIFSVRFPHKLFNYLPFEKQLKRLLKGLRGLDKTFQPQQSLSKNLVSIAVFDEDSPEISKYLGILGELSNENRKLIILCPAKVQSLFAHFRLKAHYYLIPPSKGIGDTEIEELKQQIKNQNAQFLWDFTKDHHPLDLYLACQSLPEYRINFDTEAGSPFINLRFPSSNPTPSSLRQWFQKDFQKDFYWQYKGDEGPKARGNEVVIGCKAHSVPSELKDFIDQAKMRNQPLRFLDSDLLVQEDLRRAKGLIVFKDTPPFWINREMGWCPYFAFDVRAEKEETTLQLEEWSRQLTL